MRWPEVAALAGGNRYRVRYELDGDKERDLSAPSVWTFDFVVRAYSQEDALAEGRRRVEPLLAPGRKITGVSVGRVR